MSKMRLDMQIKATDAASPALKKVANTVVRDNKRIQRATATTAAKHQNATKKNSAADRRAAAARQRLGVRTEQQIRREIARTQAAYNRLARSGAASASELNRAYTATTNKVSRLNQELGKTTRRQSKLAKLRGAGAAIGGVAAGVTAAGMVLAAPARRQMTYDRQLAMVANTAFSERDVAGRISGKDELHKAVQSAVKTGGGTKEQALGALDTLLASGSVDSQTAMDLLPTLQKAAVATGASTDDLSKIAISAMQQFGIKKEDIGAVLDKAAAAGQAGNFELADMARWLPQQMAAAKQAGMSGMGGYEALLVANQQARVTAGTSDEAGNNLVNFLAKLTSKETNERFEKINYRDKDGKIKGIDFLKSMEKGKNAGKNSIQAFMGIMDKVVGGDKHYQKLQSQLKGANQAEQKRLLAEMTKLVEGTALGRIISDRQALMAMVAIRNNKALGAEVAGKVKNSQGAVDTSHQVISSTNDAKTNKLKNALDFAEMEGIKGFNDLLGSTAEKLSNYADKYPGLTANLVSGAEGLTAVSTAAGVAAASLYLFKGRGAGGKLAQAATTASGAVAVNTASKAAAAGRGLGMRSLLSKGNIATLGVTLLAAAAEDGNWQRQAVRNRKNNAIYGAARGVAHERATPSIWAKAGQGSVQSGGESIWSKATGAYAEAAKQRETQIKQFQQMTEKTEQGLNALANQPIVIQSTNQVYIDGAQVSETVSKQQGKRLSRHSLGGY